MDPIIILVFLVGGFILLGFIINKKLSEISDKQKPSDELLEIIRMLQTASKEDRKVLIESLQKIPRASMSDWITRHGSSAKFKETWGR